MALFFTVFTMAGVFSAVYARYNLYFEIFTVLLLVWNVNEMVVKSKIPWIKMRHISAIHYILYIKLYLLMVWDGILITNFLLTALDKYLGYKFLKGAVYE